MLTIFEYLRKLARESVLSGVQDAVDYLGGKSAPTQPSGANQESKPNVDHGPPAVQPFNAQNYLAGPGPVQNGQPEALPPPRRRGRPPNRGESA